MEHWMVRVVWSQTDQEFHIIQASSASDAERIARQKFGIANVSAERKVTVG